MGREEQLQQDITAIFLERFDVRLPAPDADLLDSGLVDSVKIVELVLELEQRFGVTLPFEDLEIEDFRTVQRLAECVARALPPEA